METKKKEKKAVLITTEHRGVFFGYVEDASKLPAEITLSDARMIVYWDSATKGVLGLASAGATKDCKIGLKVPKFTAWKITSVSECTPEAVKSIEAAPWRQ